MKTLHITGWVLVAGLAAMTAQGAVIFEDTFTNGDPADSDVNGSNTITDFWKFQGSAGGSQPESGGTLSLTTVTSTADTRVHYMISENAITGANFFDNEITLSADVSLTGGSAFETDRVLRIYVSDDSNYDFSVSKLHQA
jgi:hypothetical protein